MAKKKSESKINVYSLKGDVVKTRRTCRGVPTVLPP